MVDYTTNFSALQLLEVNTKSTRGGVDKKPKKEQNIFYFLIKTVVNKLSATLAAIVLSAACTSENITPPEQDKDLQAISTKAQATQKQVIKTLSAGPTVHSVNPDACLPVAKNCDFIGSGWSDDFTTDTKDSYSRIIIGTDHSMSMHTCKKAPNVGQDNIQIRRESNSQLDPKSCKSLYIETSPSTNCDDSPSSPDTTWSSLEVPCSPTSQATLCQGIGENFEDRTCEEKSRDEAIELIDTLHKKFSDQIEKLK